MTQLPRSEPRRVRNRKAEVTLALARYVGFPAIALLPTAELKRDLGLEPLDIVLFVLAFEDGDEVPFAFEELENAVIAAELVDVVARWLERHDREERLARDEDERSGFATSAAPS